MKLTFWHLWIPSVFLVILGILCLVLGYKEWMRISLAGALIFNTLSISISSR